MIPDWKHIKKNILEHIFLENWRNSRWAGLL